MAMKKNSDNIQSENDIETNSYVVMTSYESMEHVACYKLTGC